jgi:hypothetical protein
LGKEFALVRIDEPILDNEELGREVSGCMTIVFFSPGFLIDWPSSFVSFCKLFSPLQYFRILFFYI